MTQNFTEIAQKMYECSYYTIKGCGGDLNEWKDGYGEMLEEFGVGKPVEWVEFVGKDMNDYYHLTGTNAYPDDLHFLAFPLDGMNISALAMFKIMHGDRWFDDIVDNNARREELNYEDN